MTPGFAQGTHCAQSPVELPGSFSENIPVSLVEAVARLHLETEGSPLVTVRRAVRGWMAASAPGLNPALAWRLGVRLGHEWVNDGCIHSGWLAAVLEGAEPDQHFAMIRLAATIGSPTASLWTDFIDGTHPECSPEGRAIAASSARSLDWARDRRASLGAFLLHGAEEGQEFARRNPAETIDVSIVSGPASQDRLARTFAADTGDLCNACPPSVLLSAAVEHLRSRHGLPLSSNYPVSAAVVVRHVFDHLFWRGLLHGLARQGQCSTASEP